MFDFFLQLQPTAFINYSHFTIILPHKICIFLFIV